ncbi:unnamed protein product [Chrysoparadoxa australica]
MGLSVESNGRVLAVTSGFFGKDVSGKRCYCLNIKGVSGCRFCMAPLFYIFMCGMCSTDCSLKLVRKRYPDTRGPAGAGPGRNHFCSRGPLARTRGWCS